MRLIGLAVVTAIDNRVRAGMRELGYVEGTTNTLVARYARDKPETLQFLAAELVHSKPDVIVGEAVYAVQALQRATKTISVVFITGDPVT